MQVQLCEFRANRRSEYEPGLAWMRSGFDVSDVDFIVDREGKRLSAREVEDYHLISGPHCYIDTKGRTE